MAAAGAQQASSYLTMYTPLCYNLAVGIVVNANA